MSPGTRGMTALYARRLREGLEYQDFAVHKLYEAGIPLVCFSTMKYQNAVGENIGGVEIKFDREMSKTGNVYVETMEKSDPKNKDYVPSGIYRNDSYKAASPLAGSFHKKLKNSFQTRLTGM